MQDILPFPRITQKTAEGQLGELITYIAQLKETLEFILTNISTENLSPDLLAKISLLGEVLESGNGYREEELAQVSGKSITVSDVINTVSRIKFSVNFDTGNLEYTVL